jgi:hypothetical protein
VVLGAEAEAAYAAGDLTARQYLNARSLPVFIAFNAFTQQPGPADGADEKEEAADPAFAAELVRAELEITERLGDQGRAAVYQRMLAQLAFRRDDRAEARVRLELSRDCALRAEQPWDAVEPAEMLAQLALQEGDAPAAEGHARDALTHGGDLLDRKAQARLYSLTRRCVRLSCGRARASRTPCTTGLSLRAHMPSSSGTARQPRYSTS